MSDLSASRAFNGVDIGPPRNDAPWGMREFAIAMPDGRQIALGHAPK